MKISPIDAEINSGPGSVAGAFIHEKHHTREDINRLEGWWGTQENERFQMKDEFESSRNADSWQLSNAPILSMAAHKASLDVFEQADVNKIWKKNRSLSGYLRFLLNELKTSGCSIHILTPENETERGCQWPGSVQEFSNFTPDGFKCVMSRWCSQLTPNY